MAPSSSTALHSTTRRRSRVSDPSGPSPVVEHVEPDVIDLKDIPEAHYREEDHPVPGQPWRRGMTAGCEDPLDAPWRREAERMIRLAVEISGGRYVDTTWYLTFVDVTIGEEFQQLPRNLLREDGAEIEVETGTLPPWADPEEEVEEAPEPIWQDEDDKRVWFEQDLEREEEIFNQTYAKLDWDQDPSEDDLQLDPLDRQVSKSVQKEYREDQALRAHLLQKQYNDETDKDWFFPGEMENDVFNETSSLNTGALSTIGGAILEALEDVEEELQVLARHKIIMSTPSEHRVLDTQKKFDKARGKRVRVRTQDPWKSNRVLYGVLVDRNSMDVYINQKGNMVTIPNNFVGIVELMEDYEEQEEADLLDYIDRWMEAQGVDKKLRPKIRAEKLAEWKRNKGDLEYLSKVEMQDFGEDEEEEIADIEAFLDEEGVKGKRRESLKRMFLADWKKIEYRKLLISEMEDEMRNSEFDFAEDEEEDEDNDDDEEEEEEEEEDEEE
jgi:hypothetical protein